MESDDELYNNLVTLLKFFKGKPYHLAKYLIDNSALDEDFINLILKSDKIREIKESLSMGSNLPTLQFNNINDMESYFNSLQVSSKEDPVELSNELNAKMDILIKDEKFEEAARLRDYMIHNRIRRR